VDLLIKVWPIFAAAAPGLALVVGLLWRISAGVANVNAKLDVHGTAITDLKSDVKELRTASHAHSTQIAALEARA